MFIELHIIQNFAPSNLNRDDTNSPKDCTFGGTRRARISSQCLKRAIRTAPVFRESVADRVGVRTKHLCEQIVMQLGRDPQEAREVVAAILAEAGYKQDGGKTSVLLYLSPGEIDAYAAAIKPHYDRLRPLVLDMKSKDAKALAEVNAAKLKAQEAKANGEKVAEVKTKPVGKAKEAEGSKLELGDLKKSLAALGSHTTEAADIALFGRMVAETTNMNIDAACQVAHAISTHPVAVEMDFYTAVDDLQPKEETGAGMMGIIEYNSACFYRYAVVKIEDLERNLHGDRDSAVQAAIGFCKAAVAAIPSGKQNSMAAHNPPSYIGLKVRTSGQPWSLTNAFVESVRVSPKQPDLVRLSIEKLRTYDRSLSDTYGAEGVVLDRAASTYTDLRDDTVPGLWQALAAALK